MLTSKLALALRVATLGILLLLLLVPTSWVDGLIVDRKIQKSHATDDIAQVWGNSQEVVGPYLLLRYKQWIGKKEPVLKTHHVEALPSLLEIASTVEASERFRGIYGVPVYESLISVRAEFSDAIRRQVNKLADPLEVEAFICFGVSDRTGLLSVKQCKLNGKEHEMFFQNLPLLSNFGLCSKLDLDQLQRSNVVDLEFALRGTRSLKFAALGAESSVSMTSNWQHPKFTGDFLPTERSISDKGFSGNWEINSFNSEEQVFNYTRDDVEKSGFVGVDLFQSVSNITLVDRITKYSLLVIALTFITLFLFEVLYRLRIHPMQYGLIGISLVVFYVLLLGLGEHLTFGFSYLLSSLATIFLIFLYVKWTTKVKRCIYTTLAMLVGVYSYMYVIIRLEDFALLAGSVGVFVALGIVMFATRNVDWYALHTPKEAED